jgi:P-type Mg2+ transporter
MKRTFLQDLFAGFLRARRILRHFRRLALLDTVTRTGVSREIPPALARELADAAGSQPDALLQRLDSHIDGLTESQAAAVRDRVGPNEVEHEKPLPWWRHLWLAYRTPFSLLLTLLAMVSYVTEDMEAAIVISSMVVLATLMRFWQETKSNRAAEKLKAMVHTTATVARRDVSEGTVPVFERYSGGEIRTRPSRRLEIPIRDLVPGDVVVLSAGDMIPADCRVLSAKDMFVTQAAMTGESLPVEKFAALRNPATANPFELENILFMGTNVVSGSATALVVNTANRTYFGTLAARITSADPAPPISRRA